MKLDYTLLALNLAVGMLSIGAYAGEYKTLDCNPPGYDGTPRVKGEIIGDSILDGVTETYVFEQGDMEPSKLGKIVAEALGSGYETRVFVLENDKSGTEYLLLPKQLAELPPGSKFKATYSETNSIAGKPTAEHRSLDCKVGKPD